MREPDTEPRSAQPEARTCPVCGAKFFAAADSDFCPVCILHRAFRGNLQGAGNRVPYLS
jgi:hypothetical protein